VHAQPDAVRTEQREQGHGDGADFHQKPWNITLGPQKNTKK
jgi:hypothetical protein